MKAIASSSQLEKMREKVTADVAEIVLTATAFHLCDHCGFDGEGAAKTIQYIMQIVGEINESGLTTADMREELRKDYGITVERKKTQRGGTKLFFGYEETE